MNILIIILMAIFSYNVLLKTEKMEIIKQQFSSISTDKSIQVLLLTWGFGGLLEAMAGFGTAVAIPAAILVSLGFKQVVLFPFVWLMLFVLEVHRSRYWRKKRIWMYWC